MLLHSFFQSKGKNSFFGIAIIFFFTPFFNGTDGRGIFSAFTASTLQSNSFTKQQYQPPYHINTLSFNKGNEFTSRDAPSGQGGVYNQEDTSQSYLTTPDGALVSSFAPLVHDSVSFGEIMYYVVQEGDTISEIAERFGISAQTILWANNLPSADYIRIGEELEIMPVNGVKYIVKRGDTVSSIAQRFSSGQERILAFNNLSHDGFLHIGDQLIIPGGSITQKQSVRYAPSVSQKAPDGYFIFPTIGKISQGLHGYNAVDIANTCGTYVYAAADGRISSARVTASRAKYGASAFGGYGNHIKVSHQNGVITLYAHLKEVFVQRGQQVKKGEVIGSMGGGFESVNGRWLRMRGAGRSTGCHLHFEARGVRNPALSR